MVEQQWFTFFWVSAFLCLYYVVRMLLSSFLSSNANTFEEYSVEFILLIQNDVRNSALQLASAEQRKADENVLRLVEEQKVRHS